MPLLHTSCSAGLLPRPAERSRGQLCFPWSALLPLRLARHLPRPHKQASYTHIACLPGLPACLPQDKALRKAAKKGGSDKFGNMDPMGGWIRRPDSDPCCFYGFTKLPAGHSRPTSSILASTGRRCFS